jgi:hypothetical protein
MVYMLSRVGLRGIFSFELEAEKHVAWTLDVRCKDAACKRYRHLASRFGERRKMEVSEQKKATMGNVCGREKGSTTMAENGTHVEDL